jgi:hypothetical protein
MGDINYGVLLGIIGGILFAIALVTYGMLKIDAMDEAEEIALEEAQIRAAITKARLSGNPHLLDASRPHPEALYGGANFTKGLFIIKQNNGKRSRQSRQSRRSKRV